MNRRILQRCVTLYPQGTHHNDTFMRDKETKRFICCPPVYKMIGLMMVVLMKDGGGNQFNDVGDNDNDKNDDDNGGGGGGGCGDG
ncbi:hypothetical protein ElyMa_004518800 [Elysia marginata]|uniref:Uncharacterized protein n=1 Tax=Elysia marginata TaxID=1093978 RepID=A0AAV4HNZ4_9GAST|nr:hypothetical protein ElyMa_004518800 [Elysia marginata]